MNSEKIQSLTAAIEAAEISETNQIAEVIAVLYESILKKLRTGVHLKVMLQIFKDQGYEISATTFRKFFEIECAKRGIEINTEKKGKARYSI